MSAFVSRRNTEDREKELRRWGRRALIVLSAAFMLIPGAAAAC